MIFFWFYDVSHNRNAEIDGRELGLYGVFYYCAPTYCNHIMMDAIKNDFGMRVYETEKIIDYVSQYKYLRKKNDRVKQKGLDKKQQIVWSSIMKK